MNPEKQILRLCEITQRYGLSKSSVYREIRRGRFPQSVCLTARIRGWRAQDLDQWYRGLLCPGGQLPLPFDSEERP